MNSNKITQKVLHKLGSSVKTASLKFETKGVELEHFHQNLNERLLSKLKKEWNLQDIDTKELDWDWKKVDVDWEATFPKSSGVLNISITAPDQKIVVSGKVTYYSEELKDDLEFLFVEQFEIKDVETIYRKVKLGSDISPKKLTADGKNYILSFE